MGTSCQFIGCFIIILVWFVILAIRENEDWYKNYDLDNIVTPVKVDRLEELLRKYGYDPIKRDKLVNGFKTGFSLNYQGNKKNIQMNSPNLKLRVGSQFELWNKVMKEVKDKQFAGPFEKTTI